MQASILFGTRARAAILARTYLDPSSEYHLRDLVRLTGLAPRTVHQEVEKLVAAGLLTDRRSSNRRYLRANERYPLFRPVREIVLRTAGLADVLRNALGKHGIELALVFGSIASGRPRAGSDVDLLLVGSLGLREGVRRLRLAQETLGREINPVVWTRSEFETRRVRQDPFLTNILDGPIIPVLGDWQDESGGLVGERLADPPETGAPVHSGPGGRGSRRSGGRG